MSLGIHSIDILTLAGKQLELYKKATIQDIYQDKMAIALKMTMERVAEIIDQTSEKS